MIKLLIKGKYRLVITKDKRRILYLEKQGYLWDSVKTIGELLTFSKHSHIPQYVLAEGDYRIFGVKKEKEYIDLQHLELCVGSGKWQGYLLLTGLPTRTKIRSRIIPTNEVIRIKSKSG